MVEGLLFQSQIHILMRSRFFILQLTNKICSFAFSWDQRKPHKERLTLLKSAFVHKKHRVQYEIRTYFKFMHFHKLTGSTLSTYLEYIERNLPEGVALKATKVEVMELPEHLWQPPAEVKTDDVKQ